MAALVAEQKKVKQRRQQPIGHGVFRQQSHARRRAHRPPPAPAARLARADEGVKRQRPGQQQRRIGRNHRRRNRNPGQCGIGQGGPESGARIVKPLGHGEHRQRRGEMEERRREAHRRLAVAERVCRQRDQPRHQRRLGVVAPGRVQRPQPVLRLVGIKVGAAMDQPQQPRQCHGEDGIERVAPVAHIRRRIHRFPAAPTHAAARLARAARFGKGIAFGKRTRTPRMKWTLGDRR